MVFYQPEDAATIVGLGEMDGSDMEWQRAFTAKHKKEHVILPVITILIGILLTVFIALM